MLGNRLQFCEHSHSFLYCLPTELVALDVCGGRIGCCDRSNALSRLHQGSAVKAMYRPPLKLALLTFWKSQTHTQKKQILIFLFTSSEPKALKKQKAIALNCNICMCTAGE
ncbi:Hypothetical predicted protein [Pelobates cultripes]|uniref:Uncharacterized protein n=1 Tax=Pelobates cultripes TaxID=61616 RepID=A0AAD1WM85_PELCU|nr:Hypothetical predicted protein [Pelobates cultripes]